MRVKFLFFLTVSAVFAMSPAAHAELAAKSYALGAGGQIGGFEEGLLLFADYNNSDEPKAYTDGIGLDDLVLKELSPSWVGDRCLRTNANGFVVEHSADCGGLTISGTAGNMVKIDSGNSDALADSLILPLEITLRNLNDGNWRPFSIPIVDVNTSVPTYDVSKKIISSRIRFSDIFMKQLGSNAGCLNINTSGEINSTGVACGSGSSYGTLTFGDIHTGSGTTGSLITAQATDVARGKFVFEDASANPGIAYAATVPGMTSLATGARFIMKLTNANVCGGMSPCAVPTLNVNNLGAKSMAIAGISGFSLTAGKLKEDAAYLFVYDGTSWNVIGTGDWDIGGLSISGTEGNIVKLGGTQGAAGQTTIEDSFIPTNRLWTRTATALTGNRFVVVSNGGTPATVTTGTYGPDNLGNTDCSGTWSGWQNLGGTAWIPTVNCKRFGNVVTVSFWYKFDNNITKKILFPANTNTIVTTTLNVVGSKNVCSISDVSCYQAQSEIKTGCTTTPTSPCNTTQCNVYYDLLVSPLEGGLSYVYMDGSNKRLVWQNTNSLSVPDKVVSEHCSSIEFPSGNCTWSPNVGFMCYGQYTKHTDVVLRPLTQCEFAINCTFMVSS